MRYQTCAICGKSITNIIDARIEWGYGANHEPYAQLCHNNCSFGVTRNGFVLGDLIFNQNCNPDLRSIKSGLEDHQKILPDFKDEFNKVIDLFR